MSQFFEDLVQIRKSKRLSKQDVFYKCRIPIETIESIEDGSILSGTMRNKTYIRSYFRTYAKAIGISDEDVTTALDEHDAGLYNQGLLIKYLPDQTEKVTGSPEQDKEAASDKKAEETPGSQEKEPGKKDSKKTEKKDSAGTQKTKTITPETQEKTISDIEWEDKSVKKIRSTSTTSFSSAEPRGKDTSAPAKLPDPPKLEGIDWASKVKQAVYRPQRNRLLWVILATLLALALALASIVWYWRGADPDPAEPSASEIRTPTETVPSEANTEAQTQPIEEAPEATDPVQPDVTATEEAEAVEETQPPPAPPTREEIAAQIAAFSTTGDTLYIHAYALLGNLEPIRVVSDIFAADDLQTTVPRPYWVEQYHAMRFDFLDEIMLQGSLARMVLLFNGHIIEDFEPFFLDGSRIRITRDLLMENDQFQIAESDPFSEMPPPRRIVDRPRFSP